MKDKKTMIIVIIALIVSIIGIGIAFAAFSQTLTINGNASVEASNWEIVFEGMTNASSLDNPTVVGTAEEVTHPSIKNNATEISNYEVLLKTPGDSITYNFKVHNKGSYAANLASLTISGVNRPASPVTGSALVTDSSVATQNANTLNVIEYKFYYTDNNQLVGQDAKDCLEPGESENVSLRITFASSSATDTSILPSTDLVLDNLGVTAIYNQSNNGECSFEPYEPVTDSPFANIDGAYYTYEGKSFIGTGVSNIIITENIISQSAYSSNRSTECSDGEPTRGEYNEECPEGTTYIFPDYLARSVASNYCSNCRLMKETEAVAWDPTAQDDYNPIGYGQSTKRDGKYNGNSSMWWLDDATGIWTVRMVAPGGSIAHTGINTPIVGIRPVADISSTATMTGSGTSTSPYVITQ